METATQQDQPPQGPAQGPAAMRQAPPASLDLDEVLERLERWSKETDDHWADWLEDSRRLFDLIAGRQWSDSDQKGMADGNKIAVTFNRCGPVIDAVCGAEILGRQEVGYYPRTLGDSEVNEIITRGAEWIRDRCDAPAEESAAARDTFICGLGCIETHMEFEENPKGQIVIDSVEALTCLPDPRARKPNARDKRFLRLRTELTPEEFEEEYPDFDGSPAGDGEKPRKVSNNPRDDYDDRRTKGKPERVTVDLWQWYERQTVYVTPSMDGRTLVEYAEEEFLELQAVAASYGRPPLRFQKRKRRCYYEAVVTGGRFVQEPKRLRHNRFRFNFMTGKRDKEKGCWYGVARPMEDPQKWANTFFSMVLHILRTNAKGGLVVEESAGGGNGENPVTDRQKFEQSWSKSDEITWVADGALSGERIKPKQPPQIPAAMGEMFEQSVDAIRDVSGVSKELMGLVEHNQPGVLEHQRKQASFGILASFFDSFRSYRREEGELLLRMMRDLPRGTLVRVVGEDGKAKYVPLAMDQDVEEYDVIVSDAPSGPNQKERNWSLFIQLLPAVKDMMSAEIWLEVLRYSPFPEAFVAKIREVLANGGEDEKQQMMEQLKLQFTVQGAVLDQQQKAANVQKTEADARATETKTHLSVLRPDPNPQLVA